LELKSTEADIKEHGTLNRYSLNQNDFWHTYRTVPNSNPWVMSSGKVKCHNVCPSVRPDHRTRIRYSNTEQKERKSTPHT